MPQQLPLVSSLQCAMALARLGFALQSYDAERLVLLGNGRRVVLPRRRVLGSGELTVVLKIAGVDVAAFLEVLPPGSSGTFRKTDFHGAFGGERRAAALEDYEDG